MCLQSTQDSWVLILLIKHQKRVNSVLVPLSFSVLIGGGEIDTESCSDAGGEIDTESCSDAGGEIDTESCSGSGDGRSFFHWSITPLAHSSMSFWRIRLRSTGLVSCLEIGHLFSLFYNHGPSCPVRMCDLCTLSRVSS
jgi:hypothetical protein